MVVCVGLLFGILIVISNFRLCCNSMVSYLWIMGLVLLVWFRVFIVINLVVIGW